MMCYGKLTINSIDSFLEKGYELLDIVEGNLIDNYLLTDGKNYFLLLETYLNCWSSCHSLYEGTEEEIYTKWNDMKDWSNIQQLEEWEKENY